ncbi:MAG: YkvA family protein [Intestinibacter bartlettii]|uniref:YkvA family protein n=1 Tax=Intestinibacter bartlettii TaxID=261299 RepID=UPI0026F36374|nr:YkvA family protein [Intestinibacter bartlettii]MDO5010743.1 YkvA family protein [Intestinibacter bartlettii]
MDNKFVNILNRLLDWFKLVLVRFKNAGFGLFFIKNVFIIPDFFKDKDASIFSKVKVGLTFFVTLLYFMSSIDLIPEILLGGFGFIDDIFVLMWSIGLVNEEINNYKIEFENSPKSKIIEDVNWKIHDDE